MIVLVICQLAATQGAASLDGVTFDLSKAKQRDPDAIIVTGRRTDHRLKTDNSPAEPPPIRAETRLFGNARASAEVEQSVLANGAVSDRAMIKLKIPF
ncbi:hypothetical protein [Sphingobium sp. CR28]|uniref:hypothetical protein n=1 Tax=Sphingobium sp. CR28 TaxID=3400272 RepID=UPI003FEEE616